MIRVFSPRTSLGLRFFGDSASKIKLDLPLSPVLPHSIYSEKEVQSVEITHRPTAGVADAIAFGAVKTMRTAFDLMSGYTFARKLTADMLLTRMVFLETVAGVPGLVSGMTRHAQSLAFMRRDRGWINMLLEEAENERMHLLTFLEMKKPGKLFRLAVMGTQAVFWPVFFSVYVAAPSFCHRFVGYLEEEAVRTYTHAIDVIEKGEIPEWKEPCSAPELAMVYWKLKPQASVLDVLYAVRADEAGHRDANHTLGSLPKDAQNPLAGTRYTGCEFVKEEEK